MGNCEELISRQVAVDAIGKLSDEIYRTVEKGATFPTREWFDGMAQAEHIVKNLPSAQPEQRWIPVSERQPDKPGVYLVTVFNREWVGDDIMQGAKPPKDEYWDDHKNHYARRQDGKWVMTGQRVWNGECWTGYGEIQLAWMEMPAPYTEEDNG